MNKIHMNALYKLIRPSLMIALCAVSLNGFAQTRQVETISQTKTDRLELIEQPTPDTPVPLDPTPISSEPTAIANPNSQYSVGSIHGSFDVNGMGAATYMIPIEMPIGGGIEPHISIVYNSQSSNYGLLGYGFDVSGISVITRTGYNKFTDGVNKGVTYTSSDNYCLDGKRLILKSGTNGQEGSEYTVEGDPYTSVFIHGSYSNSSANTWFEVKSPDGSVYTYGKSDNSRLSYTNSKGYARIASWSIDEAQDKYSNYITYTYTKQDYKLYPSTITYGTNKLQSRGITNKVSFVYENISENIRYFSIEDKLGKISKRIQSITSSTNNQTYRKYTFKYDDSSDKNWGKCTRLISITEENEQGSKYVPTTITWNNLDSPSISHQKIGVVTDFSTAYETIKSKSFLSVDLTGDGVSDIVQLCQVEGKNNVASGMYVYISTSNVNKSTGKVSFDSSSMRRWYVGNFSNIAGLTNLCSGFSTSDIDGDGINDLLLQCYENSGDEVAFIIYYWIYGKDIISGNTSYPVHYKNNLKSTKSYCPLSLAFDVNADGKDEICYVENSSYNGKYYGKIYSNIEIKKPVTESEFALTLNSKPEKIFKSDFNNDGLPDIVILYKDGYKIYYNNGGNNLSTLFTESNSITGTTLKNYDHIQQGDFDGDGLMDFVLYPSQDCLSLYRNNGNGTFTQMSTITGTDINDKDTNKDDDKFSLIVEDFDGDGRSDVMICKGEYDYHGFPKFSYSYDKTQIRLYYSTGSELKLAYSINKDREDDALQKYIFTGDFDGDGMVEIANYGSQLNSTSTTFTENQINIYKLTSGIAGLGKISSISDGMGSNSLINYDYITNPSVYSKTAESSYPVKVYTVPLSVVSSSTVENGSLGSQNVKYNYADFKVHGTGRGIMGFTSFKRNNTTLGEIQENTVSEMDKTYWIPKKVISSNIVGGKTSTVVTISNIEKVKNTYFSYEFSKESKDFDGNKITTVTYYDESKGVVTDQYVETSESGMYKETLYEGFVQKSNTWLPEKVTLIQKHTDDDDEFVTTTEFVYDSKGNILTEIVNSGTDLALTTTKTYDNYGNIKSSVNRGKGVQPITVYNLYDKSGRFVSKKYQNPSAAVNTYTYDIWGNVLTENDETEISNILTTTYTYDGWGNLISVSQPDGSIKKYTYNWENNFSSLKQYYVLESEGCLLNGIFSSTKPWVKTWYDKAGNETIQKTVGPKNIEISKSTYYNINGNVARIENKYGNLLTKEYFSYDKFGRIVNDSLSTGKVMSYSYESNGDGKHTIIINDNGRITKKTTDSWGNICSVTDAIGGITKYYYSSNGKPTMVCFGNVTVEMGYDKAGNQISLTDPDAGTMTYEYSADGTLIKETDGRGVETVNTFDNLGRIISTKVKDFTVSNEYGSSGTEKLRLVRQTTGTNSVEFVHDEYGRIIRETKYIQGESPIVYIYEYNTLNQISKAIYPNGLQIEYEYDQYGHKNKVIADGKVIYSLENFDGLNTKASFLGKLTSSITRDKNGFESNASILLGSTVIDSFDEEFDPATGNMLSRTRIGNLTQLFEYDDMDRLVATKRKNKSGTVSDVLRMTYAKNGNITSKSDVGNYEYDENIRPHAVVEINNNNEVLPTSTTSFKIHPIGKVQSITDDESNNNLSISYGPDFQRCLSTLTRNGLTIRKTVFGGAYEKTIESGVSREFYYLDGNVIIIRKDGKFTPYLTLTDNLGSYLAVVDSLGNKVFEANYDAWGKQSISKTNEIRLRRGYSGHEMLTEFNLINMNGRLYSPFVGRFLGTDNYVQAPDNTQSFNRYSYCLNNPLKYVDPDGNWAGIDDVFAMLIGGTVNLCSGLLAGEVKDFWHGLSLFGIGAAAGEASLYGGPLAGAAVIGIGNSVINQGFINGWGNIDMGQVVKDCAFSMATSYLGGNLCKPLARPLAQLTKNITNNVLREAIKGALSNAATGFAIGSLFSVNEEGADFGSVFKNGLIGGLHGAAIGAISGVGIGVRLNAAQKQETLLQETKPKVIQCDKEQGTTSFFDNVEYSNKVNSKIWSGDMHSFPNSVEAFEEYGTRYMQKGGDGTMYEHLYIKGSYKGYQGTFEFIKDKNGIIHHRFFNIRQ